jgi:hypothetical protein
MPLRARATRLTHQFVRLRAYFRNEFDLLRDVKRNLKALETQSAAEIHSTAIHEAGHAALWIALGFDVVGVSIIPDFRDRTAGRVLSKTDTATSRAKMAGREAFYLRHAICFYAGAEAVRQLIPTDADPDAGASCDQQRAAELIIQQIGGNAEARDFLFSLAKRRCALLVAHYQPEIRSLARALEAKLILSGRVARKVLMKSLTKRAGRPMIFATDPMLPGLAGDEAFQSFLRWISLPGRAH